MTYRDLDPKLAGIYIFKNNINGKCYIGQSVCLRKRLKQHLNNLRTKKYDLPLYKALEKYGVFNFTIDILESFIPDENMSQKNLIEKLDALEISYIEQYKAYEEGYNCTKGGDFGVLGLKMTPEQRKKVSENNRKTAAWFYKPVYMFNIVDRTLIYAISITAAANIFNVARSGIARSASGKQWLVDNCLCAFSLEELEERKKQFQEYLNTKRIVNTDRPSPRKGVAMSEEQKQKIKQSLHKYHILQYDKAGNFIQKFNTIDEASTAVNTDIKSIRRVCVGKALSCKGFIWKYELKQPDCKQVA